ncbi:MAG: peptidase M50 [Negativicutes bacterium]|nr:peptidase M50 [Negativicutes bacterium]
MHKVITVGGKIIQRAVLAFMGLAALVNFGPAGAIALSMLVSLAVYAAAFGFKFALGFVLLLLAHELGHLMASRAVGVKTQGPIFVPFIGAALALKDVPVNARMEANIAIGGPAVGTLSALVCLTAYLWTDSILMLVLAYTACLLNLFNLIPCDPLDGGKIAGAISPHMWWGGTIAIGLLFVSTHNLFILFIFFVSLLRLWRGDYGNEVYYDLTLGQRLTMLWWYVGLLLVLGIATLYIAEILR